MALVMASRADLLSRIYLREMRPFWPIPTTASSHPEFASDYRYISAFSVGLPNRYLGVNSYSLIFQSSASRRGNEQLKLSPQRPFNLLVRLVLTQRIHRPDGRGHPADQRDLQNQANNPRNRAANSEKYHKWQKNS